MASSTAFHRMSGRLHMPQRGTNYFHLHLVSDCDRRDADHGRARGGGAIHQRVAGRAHLSAGAHAQAARPGADRDRGRARHRALHAARTELTERLETKCRELGLPCLSILGPVLRAVPVLSRRARSTPRVGAQHVLNAEYFKRIDALNYTMLHDDGQHIEDLEQADVVLVGRFAHLEDADLDLSRQSRRQDRECSAGAGHAGAAEARSADAAAGGRA